MSDPQPTISEYLTRPLRSEAEVAAERAVNRMREPVVEDARIAAARTLVADARSLFERAKALDEQITPVERRFGTKEMMHLHAVLADLHGACDGLICDYGTEGGA